MNKIIKKGQDIYKYVDGGVIHGYVKSNDIPEQNPFIEWKGEKMPHALWQSILAFFNWTYIDTKPSSDEALVRIYYNEESKSWLAWAPPQRGFGMTVRTVDDHANWAQEQEFDGYALVGTGHHHCSSKAFQSGTDHSDEKLCNGLHFTIGDLDKQFVSTHARAVFNGNMQEVELDGWIDLADKYKVLNLPWELMDRAYDYSLQTKPPIETPFPQMWKDNYLKSSLNQGTMGFGNQHGHCSSSVSRPAGRGYFMKEMVGNVVKETWVSLEEKKDGPILIGNGTGHILTPSERGEVEMEQLMSSGIGLVELSLLAHEMTQNPRAQWNMCKEMQMVCDILNKYGLNPRWFEKWCESEEQVQTWQNAV